MRKTKLKGVSVSVAVTVLAASIMLAVFHASGPAEEGATPNGGAALFEVKGCSQCHYTDSRETKMGPGLEGLFDRERLPVSNRPVSEENIRRQLSTPYQAMPSFKDRLSEEEVGILLGYLKRL